jgi:hypothetical protein
METDVFATAYVGLGRGLCDPAEHGGQLLPADLTVVAGRDSAAPAVAAALRAVPDPEPVPCSLWPGFVYLRQILRDRASRALATPEGCLTR